MKIEILRKKKNFKVRYWYWRIKAANGEILCHSECYTTKKMAQKGLAALIRGIDQDEYSIDLGRQKRG